MSVTGQCYYSSFYEFDQCCNRKIIYTRSQTKLFSLICFYFINFNIIIVQVRVFYFISIVMYLIGYNVSFSAWVLGWRPWCSANFQYSLLRCWKHLHHHIVSLRGKVWTDKTSKTPPLFIEVLALFQECVQTCIYVLAVSNFLFSTIFLLYFRIVSTVWYYFVLFFILLHKLIRITNINKTFSCLCV